MDTKVKTKEQKDLGHQVPTKPASETKCSRRVSIYCICCLLCAPEGLALTVYFMLQKG